MTEPIKDAFQDVEDRVSAMFGVVPPRAGNVQSVDILAFVKEYLSYITLWKSERMILKVFYGLKLDDSDRTVVAWLKSEKGIDVKTASKRELVLCCGRRSGKSTLIAIIVVYEMYLMHQFEDPYTKFNIFRDFPIDIVCCSSSTDQATDLQDKIRALMRNVSYFEPFIDTLDKAKEIRIFTRRDQATGIGKGSLRIISKHSLSRTVRGYAAYCVVMDELAHFIDNKGNYSGDAMYKALTPSVRTFGAYGKVFCMSSPLGEGGKFFELSKQAEEIDSILYVNFATWEFNTTITREELDDEFKKDPEGATMEYGAVFGAVIAGFLPSDKVDAMIDDSLAIQLIGNRSFAYAVTVDPSKNLDRYAVAWGHAEWSYLGGDREKMVVVDGFKVWESLKFKKEDGSWGVTNIDIEEVENFIIDLRLKRMFNIGMIAYDQYQSQASIQKFQKRGMNAQETTFTPKYKEAMYGTLKSCLLTGTIKCFGKDTSDDDVLAIALKELKNLQRTLTGRSVRIGHPTVGPVQTDDLADCIANLAHILITAGMPQSKFRAPSRAKPIVAQVGGFG